MCVGTYTSRYIEDSSTSGTHQECLNIAFSSAEVARIIKKGRIPLIFFTTNLNGSPTFSLIKGRPTDEYYIISHVWADGLGNCNTNSLLACQCRQIQESFAALQDQMYEINSKDKTRWEMEWPSRLALRSEESWHAAMISTFLAILRLARNDSISLVIASAASLGYYSTFSRDTVANELKGFYSENCYARYPVAHREAGRHQMHVGIHMCME